MGIYKFDGDFACSSDSHGGIYSHLCDLCIWMISLGLQIM